MLRSTWVEHRFRSMGTDCHIVIGDAPMRLDAWAEREARRLERSWSRFDSDSDLCALNSTSSSSVAIPDLLALALDRAIRANHETGGIFDPTMLAALEHWGYDRTFNDMDAHTGAGAAPSMAPTPAVHHVSSIRLDLEAAVVSRPIGLRFDLGGIGKGYAADLIAEGLIDRGAVSACVSMGGDIRVAGTAPAGGWSVPVEDPRREGVTAFEWAMRSGAIATSTTRYRRWPVRGGEAHHLLDPATQRPTENGVTAVVVAADEAWRAEVFAKSALIAGRRRGLTLLEDHQLPGWMYFDDGTVTSTSHSRSLTPSGGPP